MNMRCKKLGYTSAMFAVTIAGCATLNLQVSDPANKAFLLPGPGPYKYDCFAHPGFFQQVHTGTTGNHLRVTGIVHVLTMEPFANKWAGLASIGFWENTLKKRTVSLLLAVTEIPPDRIDIEIRGDGGMQKTSVFASQPNIDSEIPFEMELNRGIVAISVGNAAAKSTTPYPDLTRFSMLCSGAHVVFHDVTIIKE
jgi:hypothetical protein